MTLLIELSQCDILRNITFVGSNLEELHGCIVLQNYIVTSRSKEVKDILLRYNIDIDCISLDKLEEVFYKALRLMTRKNQYEVIAIFDYRDICFSTCVAALYRIWRLIGVEYSEIDDDIVGVSLNLYTRGRTQVLNLGINPKMSPAQLFYKMDFLLSRIDIIYSPTLEIGKIQATIQDTITELERLRDIFA